VRNLGVGDGDGVFDLRGEVAETGAEDDAERGLAVGLEEDVDEGLAGAVVGGEGLLLVFGAGGFGFGKLVGHKDVTGPCRKA
jgi:hypothetical protein